VPSLQADEITAREDFDLHPSTSPRTKPIAAAMMTAIRTWLFAQPLTWR
jgi:hypothetical protein